MFKYGKLKILNLIRMNKVLFFLGIILALIAAGLMFEGSILGESTTGVAIVIGIVGIGLIATSKKS